MENNKKQRNDYILIGMILTAAVILGSVSVVHLFTNESRMGTMICVSVSGEEIGRYSLVEEQVIPIGDSNILVIHDHSADMISADCPDQVCVNHAPISNEGETIICLPNRVVVTVESLLPGQNESEIDAIVK